MLYLVLIILSVVLIFFKYTNRNRGYWTKRNIVEVHGVVKEFVTTKLPLSEIYANYYNKHENEKYIGIFLSRPAVIVKDIKDVQAVLHGDFQNFYSRGVIKSGGDILSDNVLFIDDYPRWRLVRHKMTPIFTSRKMKNMFYIMDTIARDFIENVENVRLINTNSHKSITVFTTACIAATVFGLDGNTKKYIDSPFLDMVRDALDPSYATTFKFSVGSFSPYLFKLLNLKIFGDHENFFIGFFKKVIENRRITKDVRHDYIDTCIELQKNGKMHDSRTGLEIECTDEILAAQAFFFFLAGVDTSATTMHFTLLELAGHPEILTKLHKEIDEVFAKCGDRLTYDAVEDMKYLDMVLNESMRKYPSVGQIQRQSTNRTILPAGNIQIEKDEIVVVPIYALHRDENYFPNPEVFDPERFAPENINNIKQFSFLPFGGGHRICIGERFARLQVKSGIAWFLRNHTLKEQAYVPNKFDNTTFSIKDSKALVQLIPRNRN